MSARVIPGSIILSLLFVLSVAAQNWPNWRGPGYDGAASGDGFAVHWSPTENVQWKVPLPGGSGSTPVVWGDRIFLTVCAQQQNLAICLDMQGTTLWQRPVGTERAGKHRKGSGANSSPVTDGEHVYAYFKSGDLACLALEGQIVWRTNLQKTYGEDTLWWDLGTSPVLVDDLLVVGVIQSPPAFLVAFDKETGDVVWKHDRETDAPEESAQTYATPVPIGSREHRKLVVLGGDVVTCHELATGNELWRAGGLNPENNARFRSIASPVVSGDVLVAPYGRGLRLNAFQMSNQDTEIKHAWGIDDWSPDVPTPAIAGGRVYLCMDKGKVACVDLESGRMLWDGELEKHRSLYSSSPVVADGRLYVTREDGTTFVLGLDRFAVLGKNELEEDTLATPVFTDGRVLIKTFEHLYCIGGQRGG